MIIWDLLKQSKLIEFVLGDQRVIIFHKALLSYKECFIIRSKISKLNESTVMPGTVLA